MILQDDVMTEDASNSRPHLLKGHNYGFWNLRMKAYIRSSDERAWMTVEECYLSPNKIENGVTVSKPRKTVKEVWDALQVTNEGTKAVKKSRLQMLTSQFESLQMCEEDKFVDFQDKLRDIANKCQALGTLIFSERLNWKILRSLPKRFKAKVMTIEESKDFNVMSLDELLDSLPTFEACMKPMAKNKSLAPKVVKEASISDDDEEMALLVRKFMRKGAKPSGKYLKEKEVKKSFTPPHERSGHVMKNRKFQCLKCKKLGHYALDCPNGDSKKDKKGKAMTATWNEDDYSSDEESSNDEFSGEEELVSNFFTFKAFHSSLEDVCQDSLNKEVDPNHQECLSENPTYIDLLAKVKLLEENLKIALRELREVEGFVLERDRIISSLTLGGSSDLVVEEKLIETSLSTNEVIVNKKAPKKIRSKTKSKLKNKPKCFKFVEYCKVENASRDREIELHFKHAKAFEHGKHDNVSKHVKNVRNVKNANLVKIDKACVASNVEKMSINDILVNQVVEELYSRFNIVVKENLDNVCVGSPKTKFVKGECSYQ
ncbi:hypothetical protein Q3G72_029931 [Acer saccharum]|nr:hypothetical protein Q3G72_029931 [Acer saccharum]